MTASLYGIVNSNRNFADPYYWGKNQFNSSFPIALTCYMRDHGVSPVYLTCQQQRTIEQSTITVDELFATNLPNSSLHFAFESRYEPYSSLIHDSLKPIDVVVMSQDDGTPFRALEIKLTTLPDSPTAKREESEYGCELVVRNPTTRYMALSMVDACKEVLTDVGALFEPCCHSIRSWDNAPEITAKLPELNIALETFVDQYRSRQRPLLIQPVWKTVGRSSELAEHCLDVFVWSDFAVARMLLDCCSDDGTRMTRQQRAAVRLSRFLFEASRGKVYQDAIYDGMTYGTLNDKEFALSGPRTNPYMRCERLTTPAVTKSEIRNIVLGGGQLYLSPERRFDAILHYSKELFAGEDE